jgi:hypothetical protein
MQALRVQHYLRRAADFLEGMRLTGLDESFPNSSGLLAVHAALSYADALRAGLGSEVLGADDHRKAVGELEQLLKSANFDDMRGLAQLKELLASKSLVAYGDTRLSERDLKMLATRAERFAGWAIIVGRRLELQGWSDEYR